jgi:hypothetical protein
MTVPTLVVVRRGQFGTFELLARTFAGDPTVQIIWDRRVTERRRSDDGPDSPERRRSDRRRVPPSEWGRLHYVVTAAENHVASPPAGYSAPGRASINLLS